MDCLLPGLYVVVVYGTWDDPPTGPTYRTFRESWYVQSADSSAVQAGFPGSVVTVLKASLATADWGPSVTPDAVLGRKLRPIDPNFCVGVTAYDWRPDKEAYEIGGQETTLAQYDFQLEVMLKHAVEEEGRFLHSNISKNLRALVYRDTDLQVALRELIETSYGVTERLKRWGIREQRFLSNEVAGQFIFLSTAFLWVEVETVPAT